jgi:hypothetical protein
MQTTSSLEDDAKTVINAVVRFSSMTIDELRTCKDGWLYTISRPNGEDAICGREAYDLLAAMSKRALDAGPYAGRVDGDDVFREVRKSFIASIVEKTEFSNEDVDGALRAAATKVGARCGDRTHYFPCFLMEVGVQETFAIRPVLFTITKRKLPELMAAMDQQESTADQTSRAEAENYFGSFPWMAEVRVKDCDLKTGRARAGLAVKAALDVIHLLAGQRDSSRMRVGGSPANDVRSSSIYTDPDGGVHTSWARDWRGTGIGEEWWAGLDAPHIKILLEHCEKAIETLVDPSKKQGLGQRFLDAIAWYGDGAREPSPAARTLKNITAIERLLLGKRGDKVSKRIRDRYSALCFDMVKKDRELIRDRVKRLYDDRSAIAHGEISPFDARARRAAWESDELTQNLILVWLERSGHMFEMDVDGPALEKRYEDFVARVDAHCAANP